MTGGDIVHKRRTRLFIFPLLEASGLRSPRMRFEAPSIGARPKRHPTSLGRAKLALAMLESMG